MMFRILFFLLCFCPVVSFSQDTIYANPFIGLKVTHENEMINMIEVSSACAHNHICCEVGCHCCTELQRKQLYDTIYYPFHHDVQRITVVEKFVYASSHDKMPVHYRFRNQTGTWSKKYYCVSSKSGNNSRWQEGVNRYPAETEKEYEKTNRILVVDQTGDYSLIDLEGNSLPIPFHSNELLSSGVYLSSILVNNQRVYGFSDGKGNKTGRLCYTRIGPFDADGIAIASGSMMLTNDTYGFGTGVGLINSRGEVVLPLSYEGVEKIGPNRYAVIASSNYNGQNAAWRPNTDANRIEITNSAGTFWRTQKYRQIEEFSEGLAFATKEDKKIVYLDTNGWEVIRLNAEWGYAFHDGLAAVMKDGKWGYIDTAGQLVIDFQFDRALNFENDVAPIAIGTDSNTDQWKLIDKKGKVVSGKVCDEMEKFKNGLSRVQINGKGETLINTEGKELFPCRYSFDGYGEKENWFINGLMIRSTIGEDSSLEITDEKGEQVLSLKEYVAARFVSELNNQLSLPYVQVYEKEGDVSLIDLKGKKVLDKNYRIIFICSETRAIGTRNDQLFLIDLTTGKELKNLVGKYVQSAEDGIISIQRDERSYTYDYYDMDGELLEAF